MTAREVFPAVAAMCASSAPAELRCQAADLLDLVDDLRAEADLDRRQIASLSADLQRLRLHYGIASLHEPGENP